MCVCRKIGPVEGTETWNDILKSDSRTKEDDYVSIRCEEYGTGEYLGDKQEPWRVYFSSIALTIADLHAHLNDWEGGGLLYGEVDEEKRYVAVVIGVNPTTFCNGRRLLVIPPLGWQGCLCGLGGPTPSRRSWTWRFRPGHGGRWH